MREMLKYGRAWYRYDYFALHQMLGTGESSQLLSHMSIIGYSNNFSCYACLEPTWLL